MSHLITGNNGVDRVIFRDYIGVKPYSKPFKFPDIDNIKIDEFHVILAFAHEIYEGGKGTGNFYPDWDLDICAIESVKEIKDKYPDVKVIFSIGGRDTDPFSLEVPDTQTKRSTFPFNPIEKEKWCDNAVDSLKKIIQDYYPIFAGIDINYEHINNTNDENDFSNYVGDVIKRLKDAKVIDVVSIAPSHENDRYYNLLYKALNKARPDYINWVDYQFYMQPVRTETEFLNLFCSVAREYALEKLLVGASTDPRDGGNVPLDVFVKTCTDLIKGKSLSGIFIWNANDYEKIALHILSNN